MMAKELQPIGQNSQQREEALWREFVSNVSVGTGNNFILRWTKPAVLTFRSYYRVKEAGPFRWRFWFSNTVDSQFAQGEQAWSNRPGGSWQIRSAAVAVSNQADGSLKTDSLKWVTYNGCQTKQVDPDECFWSDEVTLSVQKHEYLVFTWCIAVDQAGDHVPFTPDSQIPAYIAPGDQTMETAGEAFSADVNCAKPNQLAVARPVRKRIVFLGDSITQGCGTRIDYYEQWAVRIGQSLPADIAVWNLGLGYARAANAATNGAWLAKARYCDEINICLGVNDLLGDQRSADEVLADLAQIIRILKDSGVTSVILLTVPPFNFTAEHEQRWRRINQVIRINPPAGVDRVFDLAAVLSKPAPEENISRFDPHPDGEGGAEIADAYMAWY